MSIFDDDDDEIEREIRHKEYSRARQSFRSKEPLGYCELCGDAVFKCDKNGVPYRLCYRCFSK